MDHGTDSSYSTINCYGKMQSSGFVSLVVKVSVTIMFYHEGMFLPAFEVHSTLQYIKMGKCMEIVHNSMELYWLRRKNRLGVRVVDNFRFLCILREAFVLQGRDVVVIAPLH